MKRLSPIYLIALAGLALLIGSPAQAESHRATHLGNPATRFAPPRSTPEDLRALFRNDKLRPDFAAVLKQWGWSGNIEDMFAAAAAAEISDIKIPVGTTMPFMSSRENGKPICLRNVLWAGEEPAPAYAFNFTSEGRAYRCVTPKACSNFFLEDLGTEPKPGLTLNCDAPQKAPVGHPVNVCLTVINTGNALEPAAKLTLLVPAGAELINRTDQGVLAGNTLTWEIPNLAPSKGKQVCAGFKLAQPGTLSFTNTVVGRISPPAPVSTCQTEIIGIPAIRLEVVDLEDPVEVGQEEVYVIEVTNQGTAIGTNIRLVCTLPVSQTFVSGAGTSAVHVVNQTVNMDALPRLASKAVATWRVVVKAVAAGDARFKVELTSDQFEQPIQEAEATRQY